MKLELERSAFLKAWQVAEKYAASKTTLDALNGIRITADNGTVTLEATDLKSSVKCRAKGAVIIEPGVAVLNASIVGNMIRKCTAKTIVIDVPSERGSLTSDGSKYRFTVIPADTFPNIPASSGAEGICSIMAADLGKLLNEGSCAASAPSDFPKYMGTCLLRTQEGSIYAVSTDGKRLARSKMLCNNIYREDDLLLPAAALRELAKVFTGQENVKVLADGSTVWFALEGAADYSEDGGTDAEAKPSAVLDGAEFSVRRVEASFPKYERILSKDYKTKMRISKTALLSALDRIAIIAKNSPAQIMAMNIAPQEEGNPEGNIWPKGKLRITARAIELGTASDILEAEIQGDGMQIGFNVSFFQDGLKAVGSDDVIIEFSGEEEQTRFFRDEGDDFLYMLMPIRLTPQDIVSDDDNADDFTPPARDELPADDGEAFAGGEGQDAPF
ncbi:MAG: DNA polymerase III subunit beta [Synergistaceae bacterium]|nr:DNA polymerase III subunit beta [Synergistaceae bacterium]